MITLKDYNYIIIIISILVLINALVILLQIITTVKNVKKHANHVLIVLHAPAVITDYICYKISVRAFKIAEINQPHFPININRNASFVQLVIVINVNIISIAESKSVFKIIIQE